MIWFEVEFKNQNFCPQVHLPFTLEMTTFELVTQHIA